MWLAYRGSYREQFFFASGIGFLWVHQTADWFVQMSDGISPLWRTPFGEIVVSMSSAYYAILPCFSYTTTVSVQVSGFEDNRLLTHCDCLLCDSSSSGQCFAFSFLQIPPRDGHPCRSANRSPCRADSGLSPPSHPASTTCTGTAPVKALRAMPGAPKQNPSHF